MNFFTLFDQNIRSESCEYGLLADIQEFFLRSSVQVLFFLSGVLFLSDNYHLPFLIINAIQPCPPCKHFPPEMCCQTIFLI